MSDVTDSMIKTMMAPITGMQQVGQAMMSSVCPADAVSKMMGGANPQDLNSWLETGRTLIQQLSTGNLQVLDLNTWTQTGRTLMEQMTGGAREGFGQLTSGNTDPNAWINLMRQMMTEMTDTLRQAATGTQANPAEDNSQGSGWGEMPKG